MLSPAESNACNACARSKRKCGRQVPSCARCAEKGMTCVYSRLRPSRADSSVRPVRVRPRVEVGDAPGPLAEGEVEGGEDTVTILPDDLMLDLDLDLEMDFPLIDSDFPAFASSLVQTSYPAPLKTTWFLTPDTWTITTRADVATAADVDITLTMMKQYIATLQSWFERWVATGSNPFIHARLYSATFPSCVQVAYATLASYIHRTPANTDTILRIVEERSNDLLRESGAVLKLDRGAAEEWTDAHAAEEEQNVDPDPDLFTQLARLHALLTYQTIGLLDGDIRARYVAQGHIAVQESWANRLFHSAAKAVCTTNDTCSGALLGHPSHSPSPSQQDWHLWILAESIRRIWLVAMGLSRAFSALQQRWVICPGGIMYTNRAGLWDASSATEWEGRCLGLGLGGRGFLQRFECAPLLDKAPGDVDEFGMAMLDMTVCREVLDGWRGGVVVCR